MNWMPAVSKARAIAFKVVAFPVAIPGFLSMFLIVANETREVAQSVGWSHRSKLRAAFICSLVITEPPRINRGNNFTTKVAQHRWDNIIRLG
jgi:hypothetical protein